jgi:hypothetical protein
MELLREPIFAPEASNFVMHGGSSADDFSSVVWKVLFRSFSHFSTFSLCLRNNFSASDIRLENRAVGRILG